MEIYRISCFVMLIMMFISGILLIVFPRLRHKESFYMQMLNNLNVGFFSGLMVSASVALVSYFYAREDFLANLFQTSRYIYNNLESVEDEIKKSEKNNYTNLSATLNNIEKFTIIIEADAKKVNFLNFSPFFKDSEMALQVKTVQNLYYAFEKYPDFFVRMKMLEQEQNEAYNNADLNALVVVNSEIAKFMEDLQKVVNNDVQTLHAFVSKLKQENTSKYIPWESVKMIEITKQTPLMQKTDDKDVKKIDNMDEEKKKLEKR